MPTIPDYPVLNFSGGVVRNKSPLEMDRIQLLDARNFDLSEKGRLKVRHGSQQVGKTLTGTIENSFFFLRNEPGSFPITQLLVNNNASSGVISRLIGTRLTANVGLSDTTLTVDSTSNFAASGTVEVDGDLIAYTGGGGGGTSFTGVTGINSTHLSGRAVNQWATLSQSGSAVSGLQGIYYAVLNNICFISGRAGNLKQYDGATVTDVSNEPVTLLLTNYRDRLFGAGDGSSGTNGDPRRLSFSNRGDGTTWTTASDFFDIEDQRGEYIMALKVFSDRLGIFKTNSIFTYDEVELKQRIPDVGAYNQKVVQEIGGKIYTFCPNGVFQTNLSSAKQIGEPVRQFWQNFVPAYDETANRICDNTFAWSTPTSYFLYIGDITEPTVTTDVVLEFNTLTDSWTVHSGGFTDFVHASGMNSFRFGDGFLTNRPAVFAGDTGGKVWRLKENVFLDNQTPEVVQGTDIFQDLISNTGSPISAYIETPLYDMGQPSLFKSPGRIRFYSERNTFNVEWRVENEETTTQYRPLGVITKTNQTLPFPKEAQGFRIGLRISTVNTNSQPILNGFVFEKINVIQRN